MLWFYAAGLRMGGGSGAITVAGPYYFRTAALFGAGASGGLIYGAGGDGALLLVAGASAGLIYGAGGDGLVYGAGAGKGQVSTE